MSTLELSNVFLTDFIPTIYTTPCTIKYNQNGHPKQCHLLAERNGVIIIIYNIQRHVLVLVKQFRAAAYINSIPSEDRHFYQPINVEKYPGTLGVTLEFCAGLEDKNIPTAQTAKEEVLEECGYDVPLDKLEKVGTFRNLTLTTGARTTLYYCEVTDGMRTGVGGGVDEEGENIEVVEMSVDEVKKYAFNKEFVSSPVNFMFGFYWFLNTKL